MLAARAGRGFVLESPTWRASPRWAAELGYTDEELDALNRKAIALMEEIRGDVRPTGAPIVISGCIGPQDDGYDPARAAPADAAQDYHATQIGTFADTAADMVTAITMTYADEAIGIDTRPRDGRHAGRDLVHGRDRRAAAQRPGPRRGDRAGRRRDRRRRPRYYMINCAHPSHFTACSRARGLAGANPRPARERVDQEPRRARRGGGARRRRPADLGARYRAAQRLRGSNVVGGCCGTDHRHVEAIHAAVSR